MNTAHIMAWLVGCGLLSAALTLLSIRYARLRQLLDLPGQRRSHTLPTPRGGGIGIVVAFVAALVFDVPGIERTQEFVLAAAVVVVGAVGWIDDHRSLRARWRLLAQVIAVAMLFAPLTLFVPDGICGLPIEAACVSLGLFVTALAAGLGLVLVWSINLHNFMDGINGILAMQALFVFAVATFACAHVGDEREAIAAAICFAATLGFLPFNFPKALVFMGDVGSGVLGLLVGLAAITLSVLPDIAEATGVIVCSAFVIDATCTLLSRMLRGRRWYSAHREHLYQWLVRAGFSHARVVALYMGWNVLIVLPTLLWINRPSATTTNGVAQAVAVYALGVAVWWFGKRWCLRRVAAGGVHAAA